jgi:Protein of unknown function (DUF1488)
MLKLDNVPNTVPSAENNDLGGAPNAADEGFLAIGRDGDRSMHFVIWPAHAGERLVIVRISTRELSRISGGEPFEIKSEEITAALQRYRDRIEQHANEKLKPDATEITLDLDDLG